MGVWFWINWWGGEWSCFREMATLQSAMLTVKMWAFLSIFSCPTPTTLLLLAPVLLGPGEATHSKLLGTKIMDFMKLWIMDPHSRASKKNTSHGNEALPQDTTHLIQRSCYQQGSPCQDPADNRTTRRPPDHCKETQTAVVWSCLPFIRSGQHHLARQSERWTKTGQTEEEVGRQHQGMDRPGGRQVPADSGEQRKM